MPKSYFASVSVLRALSVAVALLVRLYALRKVSLPTLVGQAAADLARSLRVACHFAEAVCQLARKPGKLVGADVHRIVLAGARFSPDINWPAAPP